MDDDYGVSRATGEGQMLAFVGGLANLRGRRRKIARLVCGAVLVVGGLVVAVASAEAIAGAFG